MTTEADRLGYARACRITPGGAQTISKRHDRYGAGVPPFAQGGSGPWIEVDAELGSMAASLDGAPTSYPSRLLDWVAGLGAVTLGHAHPAVNEAMRQQLGSGGILSLPHRLEVAVGEAFLAATGWPDGMVRWVSTGSEATEAAVRTARIATGRDLILSIGYHGWHSTWTAAKLVRPGVPEAFASVIYDMNESGVRSDLKDLWSRAAAVILEPCADAPPNRAWLEVACEVAHEHGALVISDEVIAGFRWHEHGAMLGTCGVRPDLVCFGKAIANGAFPIAALVGSSEIMQHAWPVSGTANGHPVGLAAIRAVLDVYRKERPLEEIHRTGRALRHALSGLAQAIPGAQASVSGDVPRPVIKCVTGVAETDNVLQTLLVQELARRSVLWHPAGAGNAMVGHADHLAWTVDAFAGALAVVAEARASGEPAQWLVGAPSQSALAVRP